MEEISKDEMLFHYNQLKMEDMDFLIQKHGLEKLNEYIFEQETYKAKKGVQ